MNPSKRFKSVAACILLLLACFGTLCLLNKDYITDTKHERDNGHEIRALGCSHNATSPINGSKLLPRSYSIPSFEPAMSHSDIYQKLLHQPGDRFPWPRLGDTYDNVPREKAEWRAIRYCYTDQKSALKIEPLMRHAIAMWEPAFKHSTMRITPEVRCDPDRMEECICSEPGDDSVAERWDSLQITGGPKERTKENSEGRISVGGVRLEPQPVAPASNTKPLYRLRASVAKIIQEVRDELHLRKRPQGPVDVFLRAAIIHEFGDSPYYTYCSVGFGTYNEMVLGKIYEVADNPQTPEQLATRAHTIWDIVHELGHAAGLCHEHQPNNFNEAPLRRMDVARSKDPRFENMDTEQRWDMVCTDQALAATFFPLLTAYIPGDKWCRHPSQEFDYLSAMIYSTGVGWLPQGTDAPPYTLLKHPRRVSPTDESHTDIAVPGNHIHQGGSKDYAKRGISVLDMLRIAELYPKSEKDTALVRKMRYTGWKAREVRVGSFTTVVSPAETPYMAPPYDRDATNPHQPL